MSARSGSILLPDRELSDELTLRREVLSTKQTEPPTAARLASRRRHGLPTAAHSSRTCTMHMHASCPPATATLVQSIPVGDFSVKAASGTIPTWLALVALANCSTTSLDFTAMYMDLLGTEDRQQFSPSEMTDFGADRGPSSASAEQHGGGTAKPWTER